MMDLQSILIDHPPVPIAYTERVAKAKKPTLEENIQNLQRESQIRLILESEIQEIQKLLDEEKYVEAENARLRLIYSAEAERMSSQLLLIAN
ncbi:hypothetical protein ABW20_dc0105388 [Dactylellina cionopaga]|nr:hypothetical protein ABW20_dc0105388 [Dactylellina cionopaga]